MNRLTSFLFSLLFILSSLTADAQIFDPVKWTASCVSVENDQMTFAMRATIEEGWNIYSQDLDGDGPVPTSIEIESGHKVIGKIKESSAKRIKEFDANFEMDLIKLKKTAEYLVTVDLKSAKGPVTGYLTFMVCDKMRCLPPTDIDISVSPDDCAPAQGSVPVELPEEIKENIEVVQDANKIVEEVKKTQLKAPERKEAIVLEDVKDEKAAVSTAINANGQNNSNSQESSGAFEMTGEIDEIDDVAQKKNGLVEPVKWKTAIEPKDGNRYKIIFDATIEDGWSMYSKDIDEDAGPSPTLLLIDNSDQLDWNGEWLEESSDKKKSYDAIFEADVIKLKHDTKLSTTVRSKDGKTPITGFIEYMACDKSKCIMPPPYEFVLDPATGTITIPGDEPMIADASDSGSMAAKGPIPFLAAEKLKPVGDCKTENRAQIKSSNLWTIFGLGFFGGLLALLTPCVFPMIPLTVSFFTKGGKAGSKGIRDAIIYGLFILIAYLLVSVPFHLLDNINADILGQISTNPWLNLFFFFMLVFFAFSFFGFYEITLPSSWTNKSSQAESSGGFTGIFFMALTLALVSFSCTGPILGSLLAGALSSTGGAWQLTAGFAGFGLALALPFALFAAFPSFMSALPQSGGWLNTVKVILGFIELAFAFKFLSNADLVQHWGLLKIEPFLIIWFLVFLGLALYCFGFIRFPHDGPKAKLGWARVGVGILATVISLYTLTGFRYDADKGTFKSLTWGPFSGFPPSAGYSWIYPNECPQNLDCFKDFELGMKYAEESNKPVLLDFTGYACVNCRKMEEQVWPEAKVLDQIKDDFVLISLYTDDKKKLPVDQQVVVTKATGGTRLLRTYGHKWSHFQTEYFENNSLPYYILLGPDGQMLNNPVPYTPDVDEYAAFLKCGKENFAARQ